MTSTATRIPAWVTSTISAIEARTVTHGAEEGAYPRIYAHLYLRAHSDEFGIPDASG